MRRHRPPPEGPLEPDRAFAYALRALAQRALTEREVADRLQRRGATEETVGGTLERLRAYRFVDDAGLARRAAQATEEGSRRVRARLRHRGLGEHEIEDALAARDPDADLAGALALVERHGARWTGERGYARGFSYLSRRGYPAGVVARALEGLRGRGPTGDAGAWADED